MPQTRLSRVVGYLALALETLLQHWLNWGAAGGRVLFAADAPPRTLEGRLVIVTGANTGLGLETAFWIARTGARVILACRSAARGAAAVSQLQTRLPDASVEARVLDLGDEGSIRTFAADLAGAHVHALVLNAGVMAVPHTVPETHMMVNHAGHALLLLLLARQLDDTAVFVSSFAARVSDLRWDDISFERRPYRAFTAYANSKLAQVLFARAVRARLAAAGGPFGVLCVHPGESTTDVSRHLGSFWATLHKRTGGLLMLSPREAARTAALAAVEGGCGEGILHAVDKVLFLPEWLDNDADAQRMWEATLNMLGLTDAEAMRMLIGDPRD